jgi:hypothetical protein
MPTPLFRQRDEGVRPQRGPQDRGSALPAPGEIDQGIVDTYRRMTGPNSPDGINGEAAVNFVMLVLVNRFSGGSC